MTQTDITITIHSVRDLGATIRGFRSDAQAVGIVITDDWCREQMHARGVTRYEDMTEDLLLAIADAVDELA